MPKDPNTAWKIAGIIATLVIVLIISAIITPPDIASQIIVAVPVVILYEISIYISKAVVRRQNKRAKNYGKQPG